MKTYSQLTDEQQEKAVKKALYDIVTEIGAGRLRFDDEANGNDLQRRIDEQYEEATRNQTPWFIGEMIMGAVGRDLIGMANAQAEEALYAEPDDPPVVYGVFDKD